MEIIVPNQWGNKIEVFDCYGDYYSNWPVISGENPSDKKAVSMPIAIDLNNNGNKEIVIGLEGGIYIWDKDGNNFLNQNPLSPGNATGGRMDCPVIACDIDNDDTYEILFMSIINTTGYIYAYEPDGSFVTGWDNSNHNIELSIASQTWAWPPSFVCGDINMDGNIEIVIADNNTLKVWDNIGNLVLDKTIPMLNCQYQQPLIADVDGTDTECEIIIPANNGTIHAFKLNGEPVLGWPLYRNSSTSIPFIDDIDNDQKNEIVAASGNDIYVWDSDGISDYNQWGSFRLNSYNNAVYVNSCYYSPNPLTVIADEDWNSDRILNSDLIIEDASLTIYSTVKITPSASIIVKPGAKLIINGGKLTNSCTDLWQGIQVWGNSSAHQYPDANGDYLQGYVELRNGAVVENAWEAIQPWNPEHWDQTGGIIKAYGSTFRNNRRAIQFISYQNYDPITGEHRPNQSVFKNCTFEATDSFDRLFSAPSHAFVSMYKVDGVKFYGCDFKDERSTFYDQFTQSIGIWTIDADFSVLPLCNDYSIADCWSCPTLIIDKSSFKGLNIGVYSTQSTTSSSYVIDRANFINNLFGNLNVGNDNASIIRSRFEVGTKETVSPYYPMFGIINYGATGLTILQNEFVPYEDLPSNIDFHTGIWNKDTGDDFNIIFKNDFSQMGYANLATGLNNNEEWPEIGLNYQCNTNTSNIQFDFFVNDGNGIASYQGTEEIASGNTFCHNLSPVGSDFYNEAKTAVNYFYYNGNNEDPVNYVNIYPEIAPINDCDDVFGSTTHIKLSQTELASYRQSYNYNKAEYDNTKYLFEVLKDGGDTPATISDIENAWPEETWELREQLLADSPHLSKKVLYAAADRTDVLPHTIMFEICIANPEEMRDEDFLDYLESKADPMPSYMVDDLREGADEDTYKSILQNELAGYARLWGEACNYILRDIVLDSTGIKYDSLRLWLENKGSLNSAYEIVDSYIAQDSLNNALVYLNNIPNNHDLSDYQQIEYIHYYNLKNILIYAQQQGRNILQLDSLEVLSLVGIADSSESIAGAQAQSILNFGYGYSYFMFPNLPTNPNMKQSNINEDNNSEWVKTQYERNFIEAYPNPASTWVTFDYSLPYLSTNVKIKIVDISGKPIKTIDLQSQFGQVTWDTRNIKSGLYIYSLFINNIKTEQRKLIINN